MSRVGYILRSYPRLSQTFVVNEIWALERLGLELRLFAITNPREPIVQQQVAQVRAALEYLEEAQASAPSDHAWAAQQMPQRYETTARYVEMRADLDEGYTSASRQQCFDYAVHLARRLDDARQAGQPIEHLHAHFAHDPTLIALLVQHLTGISFSFTAHARDLVQIPPRALAERIAHATVMLTCSETNIDYVNEVVPAPLRAKVRLIHHGVNLEGFQPARQRDLSSEMPAPTILSVGRLVEKKGFPDLIAACSLLKQRGLRFRCAIYGEGPLRGPLAAHIARLGLEEWVVLAGERSQQELIPLFQAADLFALAPFVASDGDRDGIPNVLVEAMACAMPVVSTHTAGIPELVRHGENGLLVPARDVAALADALAALIVDRPLRTRMGELARQTVVEHFDLQAAARQIAALFAQAMRADSKPGWEAE